MRTLFGEKIFLRALEPADIDYLYRLENDENQWKFSSVSVPFSRNLLENYIAQSHKDIYEVKQVRLVICEKESFQAVGLIDLYDFDPKNHRVAVGITVYPEDSRKKGYAFDALIHLCRYAFKHLNVHQIYAGITADNEPSIRLFERAGFSRSCRKIDWTYQDNEFKDEFLYQLFKKDFLKFLK
ncbi:MAG: GNAT family N-acetyltransferase [Bacteroidetes bacterium]|jgi:diamine N-acetyltransferase|nr:GNAT family N-acetyltransferase [Bacteroidota bacterium]